jgi:hypothetical protein
MKRILCALALAAALVSALTPGGSAGDSADVKGREGFTVSLDLRITKPTPPASSSATGWW